MRAILNGTVVAEANKEDLIAIEGNWYFPPQSVRSELLSATETPYTCPWKGVCQYFTVTDGTDSYTDRAWSYPAPFDGSAERVGRDFANYVAFWKEVEVLE